MPRTWKFAPHDRGHVATLCRETCQLHPRLDESVVMAAALTFCVGAADAFLPGAALPPIAPHLAEPATKP